MRYLSPVGTWAERNNKPAFAGWWDATGFGRKTVPSYVTSQGAYHTGADLNLDANDNGKPVYASSNGYVVFAGKCSGWQGEMVVIKHPDGAWTRYAHLKNLTVKSGTNCTPETKVGEVTDYTPLNSSSGDHLHFDVAVIDLGEKPADWPKMDLARLERDYRDPLAWIISHWQEIEKPAENYMWTPTDSINGTRVRLTPDLTADNILGVIEGGKAVDGTLSSDGKWLEVKAIPESVRVGNVSLKLSAAKTFKAYAAAQFMKQVSAPQPSSTAIGVHPALPALAFNKRVGVHTLERIEEAREAFDLGCRSFTMMNNHAGAREMRAKGAAVIVRMFMQHGVVVPPKEFANYYGVNADDTLICMGINEADNISTSEIEKRFEWDKEWALAMHKIAPKCFIVIGSFSMGTPQLDNVGVAKRFKDTYGAFLNANADWCGINYHSYQRRHSDKLPPFNQAVEDPAWWPKRFLLWGYNPLYGGLNKSVICVSDEAGVDIGGIGGFPACGYTDDYFAQWHALHRSWFETETQIYTQNIFQFSPRNDWAGYNARCVLGGLAKVWQS